MKWVGIIGGNKISVQDWCTRIEMYSQKNTRISNPLLCISRDQDNQVNECIRIMKQATPFP